MTRTTFLHDPSNVADEQAAPSATPSPTPSADAQARTNEPEEPGLILGRPAEDRAFEVVETGIGMAAGLAIGTALAGPIGAAVGGLVGAAAGLVVGEAIERTAGPAARTTDAEGLAESSTADLALASASSSGPTEPVHAGRPRPRGFSAYPTNYLLAVADTPAQAASAAAALAGAGFPAADVVVIAGPDEGEKLERPGRKKGPLSGIVRLMRFVTMDQTPDFQVYENALLEERTVVGVRVVDAHRIPIARDVLVGCGLHFLNFYGRWSTMEVSR